METTNRAARSEALAKSASQASTPSAAAQNLTQNTAQNEQRRQNTDSRGAFGGELPGNCAPLAFPYVPMQKNDPPRYSQQDAMRAGTLFPGLYLPFHEELESRFPAENTALSELMALDFAIQELGLYLTTHPNDREVLDLYWTYVRMGRQGREKYVEQYGPLMETDITPGSFRWLNDPWPWDEGGSN